VRALVRREDDRAQKLRDLGAEVIVADMLRLKEVRPALDGVGGAYLCYPLADGLVEVTAVFAMHATQVDAGGAFGVGSDSNVNINVASELTLLEYSQRLSRKLRNVIGLNDLSTGRALLQRAVRGGVRGPPRRGSHRVLPPISSVSKQGTR
jgi:hypothetical protein